MSSKDLQAVVKTQKAFIKELLDRFLNKVDFMDVKFRIGEEWLSPSDLRILLEDDYFKGLTIQQIIGLAKKSIRLTGDNCEMRHKLEDIKDIMLKLKNFEIECCLEDFIDIYVKKILDIIGEDIQSLE